MVRIQVPQPISVRERTQMSKSLNELKDTDNLKLIQLWLEKNPGKTEQDLLETLEYIQKELNELGPWLDQELKRI